MKRKLALAAIVFAAALVVAPAIAGAHVEIAPDSKLSADGTITGTLTVPNECTGSATSSLDLNFPGTPALTNVTVAPVSGWTATPTSDSATKAITKLTFTGSVSGSDEVKFALTFAGVPAGTDSISFTALQHCTNSDTIRWVQPTPAGGAEPEFPAPVLDVAQSSAAHPDTPTETKVKVTAKQKSDDSSTGIIVGVVAASVVLIGAGLVMFRRSKK